MYELIKHLTMVEREENLGIPSGDEEEVIRYYCKCGYEYSAIVQVFRKVS